MIVIIGYTVVMACIFGVYIFHGGNIAVILKALPFELTTIFGGELEQKTEDAAKELQCIKTTLLASMQGYNPSTAIEFGRKVLFSTERPSFTELEAHVRGKK